MDGCGTREQGEPAVRLAKQHKTGEKALGDESCVSKGLEMCSVVFLRMGLDRRIIALLTKLSDC